MVITSFYFDNSTRLSNKMNSLTMERRRTKIPSSAPALPPCSTHTRPEKLKGKIDDIKWEELNK
jgi:hypothetical protein